MICALEESSIDQITRLLITVHDTDQIPPDLCKLVFVVVPKKAGALECGQHRTVGLVRCIAKILGIVMQVVGRKVQFKVGEWQCGFVQCATCGVFAGNYS